MKHKYDVALSFAGENRDFAKSVACGLEAENVSVFYDEFNVASLWGEDLADKLREVYFADSRYCIMILSDHYVQKMWPTLERRNATERFIKESGDAYILPIRLNGFSGDVPGLPDTIGYLSVESHEPEKVVELFLQKIGKDKKDREEDLDESDFSPSYIPKLKKSFSDQEKSRFLKKSFTEIVSFICGFAEVTKNKYPDFECEVEKITARKTLITFYDEGDELTCLKIWIGSSSFRNEICILHGSHLDVNQDGVTNEMIYVEECEGELKLKPMGMLFYGSGANFMSSQETADYIWRAVCSEISY